MSQPLSPLLTRNEARGILRVAASTLDEWIRSNVLPSVRVGRRVYVPRQAIDDLISQAYARIGRTPGE